MDNFKKILNIEIDPAGPVETAYYKQIVTKTTLTMAKGGPDHILNMMDSQAERAIDAFATENDQVLLTEIKRQLTRIYIIPRNVNANPYWWDWYKEWDYIPWYPDIDMYEFVWTAKAQKPARPIIPNWEDATYV